MSREPLSDLSYMILEHRSHSGASGGIFRANRIDSFLRYLWIGYAYTHGGIIPSLAGLYEPKGAAFLKNSSLL
jgi:hypothetical protein